MKRNSKIVIKLGIVLLAAATIFVSCDKEFIIKTNSFTNLIVVNSLFTGQEKLSVTVTKSMHPQKRQEVIELKEAKVSLFENNVFIEELTYEKSPADSVGKFVSNTTPVPGIVYKIVTETTEDDIPQKASSQSELPQKVEIVSDTAIWLKWITEEDTAFSLRFYFEIEFNDPPGNNYYYISAAAPVLKLDTTNNIREFYTWQYAEILSGELPGHQLYINNSLLFSDATFQSKKKKITGTATMYSDVDYLFSNQDLSRFEKGNIYILDKSKLHIELHSLSKDAYNFCSSYAKRMRLQDDIYSEPVIIYSNVKNGLGIFAGENISSTDVPIKY